MYIGTNIGVGVHCCCGGGTSTNPTTEYPILAWQLDDFVQTSDIVAGQRFQLSEVPADPKGVILVTPNGTLLEGYDWQYVQATNEIELLYSSAISNYPNNELRLQAKYQFDTGTTTTTQPVVAWAKEEYTLTSNIVSGQKIGLTETPISPNGVILTTPNGGLLEGYDWQYVQATNEIELLYSSAISNYPNNELKLLIKFQTA